MPDNSMEDVNNTNSGADSSLSAADAAIEEDGNAATTASSNNENTAAATTATTSSRTPLLPLAVDLSAYFAALSKTITSNAGVKSSSVAVLLWEGVGPILAAGHSRKIGGMSPDDDDGGGELSSSSSSGLINPQQAALYLYAVAQNIVALESAVLGTFSNIRASNTNAAASVDGTMGCGTSSNNARGNVNMGRTMKNIMANQAAEIVSAVSVASTYCTPRSIITQSGILPALAHLIESTGNVPPSKFGSTCLHSITPFHPEFLQVSLLAGQYRYASAFLSYRPTSTATLDFPYLPIDPPCYLRMHYQAGLVHMGCNDWNAALDSFHLCLTMPCSTVSKLAIAARKKSLLVQCLLLESEELDGITTSASAKLVVRASSSDAAESFKPEKSKVENKVLDLPGAASAAVCKYMSASSNRVVSSGGGEGGSEGGGGGESAPERTETGSTEPSRQQSFRKERSSRRRTRGGSSSNSLLDEDRSDREGTPQKGGSASKTCAHLGSYHDLVSSYISGNTSHYAKLLSEMTELLHLDGNWELAKQLEDRLVVYRSIRRLASVYSAIGLDAIEVKMQHAGSCGQVLGDRSLEDLVMGMAACDAKDPLIVDPFFARINQSTGMVAFLDDDVDNWLDTDLSARLQSCMALAERVRDMDIAFTTSPKYLQYSVKETMGRSDLSAPSAMTRQQGGSVADFLQGEIDMRMD